MSQLPTARVPEKHASFVSYIVGFALSLVLTIGAYILVTQHVNGGHSFLAHSTMVGIIMVLAMVQLIVQLVFFLHLGREDKPRWNARVLMFAVLVVAILVVGSLWIMANLDYSHGTGSTPETGTLIIEDEGFPAMQDNDAETSH